MANYSHTDAEWALELSRAFQEYMDACWESAYAEEDIPALDGFETVSGQPFCGCDACVSREWIMFLIPRIIDAYKDGRLVEE
jgi:hypothetical protein